VPLPSSSAAHSTPVSSSYQESPGSPHLSSSSPSSNQSEQEYQIVAELSSASDSVDNESDFDFSDVDFENSSGAHLN
jgi:hypothetical protein